MFARNVGTLSKKLHDVTVQEAEFFLVRIFLDIL
jgi:hypothetical protein